VYTLVRHLRRDQVLFAEAPAFVVSLFIAEWFYKFHSFSLECLAFLATWLVLSCLLSLAVMLLPGGHRSPPPQN
jgi:hypothetical protein